MTITEFIEYALRYGYSYGYSDGRDKRGADGTNALEYFISLNINRLEDNQLELSRTLR